jgi:hypothetical protein
MQHPSPFTLDGFLNQLARGQEVASDYVRVDSESDPRTPGRTAYRLTGATKGAVERKAALILQDAADAGGRGRFLETGRVDGVYGALGETIVPNAAEAGQ